MSLFRSIFFRLKPRERILLIAFAAVLLLLWASVAIRDLRGELQRYLQARQVLAAQSAFLELGPAVEEQLQAALSSVDNSRTYSSSELVGRLDGLARSLNLTIDLDARETSAEDVYAIHRVRMRVRRGNLADLVRFNEALQQETPYIILTEFQFLADRRDPRQLDATFEIASIELNETIAP